MAEEGPGDVDGEDDEVGDGEEEQTKPLVPQGRRLVERVQMS